jgi:glycosyltransferase involved in cell wall biosynthesis
MRLVIAGDGPARGQIMQVLREGGALEQAWLAGTRADVPALLRGLDLFVLPSLAEGISNTILEAMATGLPIVATRVGGNGELIEDGRTGCLVEPADPEQLAGAILDAFHDRARSLARGRAAREAAEARFSLERMAEDYVALYEGELARRGRRADPRAETMT